MVFKCEVSFGYHGDDIYKGCIFRYNSFLFKVDNVMDAFGQFYVRFISGFQIEIKAEISQVVHSIGFLFEGILFKMSGFVIELL